MGAYWQCAGTLRSRSWGGDGPLTSGGGGVGYQVATGQGIRGHVACDYPISEGPVKGHRHTVPLGSPLTTTTCIGTHANSAEANISRLVVGAVDGFVFGAGVLAGKFVRSGGRDWEALVVVSCKWCARGDTHTAHPVRGARTW